MVKGLAQFHGKSLIEKHIKLSWWIMDSIWNFIVCVLSVHAAIKWIIALHSTAHCFCQNNSHINNRVIKIGDGLLRMKWGHSLKNMFGLAVVSHHPMPPLCWSFPTLPNLAHTPQLLDSKGTRWANSGDTTPVLIPLLVVMSLIDVAFKQCHRSGQSIHLNWPWKVHKQLQWENTRTSAATVFQGKYVARSDAWRHHKYKVF